MNVSHAIQRRDIVQVAPVLPPRVRQFARALEETGSLSVLVSGYLHPPRALLERIGRVIDRAAQTDLVALLSKRRLPEVAPERCLRALVPSLLGYMARRLPVSSARAVRLEDGMFAAVDRLAARRAIDERTALVLGREDGSLASFLQARRVGAITLYDMPIVHYRTLKDILEREQESFPGICTAPDVCTLFAPHRMERKDRELALADHIIVGSSFVQASLVRQGHAAKRIAVLPSGCVCPRLLRRAGAEHPSRENRVLHVGQLGLRKGTHRLLQAWKRLGAYRTHRLVLVGEMWLARKFLADYQHCYEHAGRLGPEQLRAQYRSACLFTLPSAAEGFAAVLTEAMSYGVPILASHNTGADGFLESGRDALLHEFANDEQLCAGLDWMLSHPRERLEMAHQAELKASTWTWADYRSRFQQLLARIRMEPGECAAWAPNTQFSGAA